MRASDRKPLTERSTYPTVHCSFIIGLAYLVGALTGPPTHYSSYPERGLSTPATIVRYEVPTSASVLPSGRHHQDEAHNPKRGRTQATDFLYNRKWCRRTANRDLSPARSNTQFYQYRVEQQIKVKSTVLYGVPKQSENYL